MQKGLLTREYIEKLYIARDYKSIHSKFGQIQKAVLEFASFMKNRRKPSGANEEEWILEMRQSFFNIKNAQIATQRNKSYSRTAFSMPNLIGLYELLK